MIVTVKFTRPGKGTTTYKERLVLDDPQVKVLLLDRYHHPAVLHDDQEILGENAPIVWFVFPGRWHEIGRFHSREESFTGWYTNLCTPFVTNGSEWHTTDLFLDFWQPHSDRGVWLDEEELREAIHDGRVSAEMDSQLKQEKRMITEAHATGDWPPHIARTIDLNAARNLTT